MIFLQTFQVHMTPFFQVQLEGDQAKLKALQLEQLEQRRAAAQAQSFCRNAQPDGRSQHDKYSG